MSESSQYPLWFGKAFKLAFDLLRNRQLCPADEIKAFVERLVAALPPQAVFLIRSVVKEICSTLFRKQTVF